MDSFEKFKECLPEKSKFYSSLSDKHIMKMKTMNLLPKFVKL